MELTPTAVVVQQVFLFKRIRTIPLDQVADVTYCASLLGRLLDYGDLYIESTRAGYREGLPKVRHALAFRERVLGAVKEQKHG